MDTLISRILFQNWQRKLVAVLSALVIWLFVNSSIIETKTLTNVPIRVVNLPPDKTIQGLGSNRLLNKRITLTLSGTKDVIQELESGDLEVLLDVSTADSDDWVVHIGKKNLVSLNPSIDLFHHITTVSHPEFVLKLSKLVTEKIPINILPPTGTAPMGYEYLDVWPSKLLQVVSGPEEDVQALKTNGIDLTFNLNDITKADLDALKFSNSSSHDDEISFPVPDKWKKVTIPFSGVVEEINDPEAQGLRIDFLRKSFLPISKEIPVQVFYPVKYSETINPKTYPLVSNERVHKVNDISLLNVSLYVKDVSRLFLDLVTENMEIIIVAAPKTERDMLLWDVEVVDAHELEDVYVAYLLTNTKNTSTAMSKRRETVLRKRFREYMQRLTLYVAPEQKLHLDNMLDTNAVHVHPILK